MRLTGKNLKLVEADLFGRLPYGVMCQVLSESPIQLGDGTEGSEYEEDVVKLTARDHDQLIDLVQGDWVLDIKPYLRPMSSMTETERLELSRLTDDKFKFYLYTCKPEIICYEKYNYLEGLKVLDWLNAHHFDYRGLIEKGLALSALEGMYND